MRKIFLKIKKGRKAYFTNFERSRGYTIIETMVAISIFLVVIMSGMGALLNANALHKKSQNMRSIIDSLSFVMEDMSKNLRIGYDYHCIDSINSSLTDPLLRDCTSPLGSGISFKVPVGASYEQWVYYINVSGKILKSINGGSNFVQLTPDEVNVLSTSSFRVEGALPPPGNLQQPFVTIELNGTLTAENVVTPFNLRTSVSQRVIDIY